MGFGEAINICADVRDARCEAATATHAIVRHAKNRMLADGALDSSVCVESRKLGNLRSSKVCKYSVQADKIPAVEGSWVGRMCFPAVTSLCM